MKARVQVFLKPGLYDPQGEAIKGVLQSIGFGMVEDCRQGKIFLIDLENSLGREDARSKVDEMCRKLLANQVIEDYTFDIQD
ncbi:MAG: phosphoribosylformylglycinamidine synthase subunit PurS [Nitrospirae bacterium]|nr:phosphoribosylformylglycinamidine synthase subunit PurS [Nitrospirota bacterium]